MGAMLRITRTDHTGTQLRAPSVKCSDSAQVRRMLAVAMVMNGPPRGEAASLNSLVWDSYDDIVEACKNAWNWLIADPTRITSIGERAWAVC